MQNAKRLKMKLHAIWESLKLPFLSSKNIKYAFIMQALLHITHENLYLLKDVVFIEKRILIGL